MIKGSEVRKAEDQIETFLAESIPKRRIAAVMKGQKLLIPVRYTTREFYLYRPPEGRNGLAVSSPLTKRWRQ